MRVILCCAAFLVIAAGPVAAQDGSQPASPTDEEIKVTGKLICKMETSIGSMMPRRVCRTKTQSREEARATADGITRLQQLQQIQDIQRQAKCRGADSAC